MGRVGAPAHSARRFLQNLPTGRCRRAKLLPFEHHRPGKISFTTVHTDTAVRFCLWVSRAKAIYLRVLRHNRQVLCLEQTVEYLHNRASYHALVRLRWHRREWLYSTWGICSAHLWIPQSHLAQKQLEPPYEYHWTWYAILGNKIHAAGRLNASILRGISRGLRCHRASGTWR